MTDVCSHAALDQLDDRALDRLPFGVVRLGPTGRIERYNLVEAQRAGIQRWRVLGRDFLRDVAGRNTAALASAIDALPPGATIRVRHTFRGFVRAEEAVIEMSRAASGHVYLCIERAG